MRKGRRRAMTSRGQRKIWTFGKHIRMLSDTECAEFYAAVKQAMKGPPEPIRLATVPLWPV
jgi:hypothetical protein